MVPGYDLRGLRFYRRYPFNSRIFQNQIAMKTNEKKPRRAVVRPFFGAFVVEYGEILFPKLYETRKQAQDAADAINHI